jgi:hypothetical protein
MEEPNFWANHIYPEDQALRHPLRYVCCQARQQNGDFENAVLRDGVCE